ncbi:MAG TPA: PD-(D/E)XK nuclease family protein, partial [Chloroflexota bacterium]|nr:PD-(D/E)XK nuclease family protein [Chloroflexota bacterium]
TLVIGAGGFLSRPELRDALALLRAAVDPLDDAALVRVMQGPLCGLSDAAVGALARHGGYGHLYDGLLRAETLPFSVPHRDEVVRRSASLVTLLERVGRRLEGLPLPDLLHDALEDSGYFDYARTRPETERERVLANLEKVRRFACVYAEAHPLATAAAFARQLSYMVDEEMDEAEESVDAGPDVVRIMTIHQAKGLEFPVVVVANATPYAHRLDEPAITYDETEGFLVLKRADATGTMREGADLARFKARQETRALEEERYVWYVALTRAKERLILATPRPLDKPIAKNQQWPLQELYTTVTSDEPRQDLAATVALETLDDLPEADLTPPALPSDEEALERVRAAARLAAREEPAPAAALPAPVILSYSALRTYRACPRRYQLAHVLRLPEVPAALRAPVARANSYDAVALGTAVQAALERYPDPGAPRDHLVAAFVASCRAQGIAEDEIEASYRPRGEKMLDLYVQRLVGAGQVQRVYAELAVRHLVRDGPIPVTFVGRIDRVDLDTAGWRLIDYKTHRALEAASLDEAALQLRLYKVAWQAGVAARPRDERSRLASAAQRSAAMPRAAVECSRRGEAGGHPGAEPRLYVYEAQSGLLHEVPDGPQALDAAVNLLCDVAGKIAAGDFTVPPGYSPPCATCPFGGPYGLCPDRRNRDNAGDPDLTLAGEVYGARRYDHGSVPGQYPMLGPNALGEDQGPIPDLAEDERAAAAPPCFLCGSGERCARSQLVGALRDVELAREDHGGRA